MSDTKMPSLWNASNSNGKNNGNNDALHQSFMDKAFIEMFFDKNLTTAKERLQVENLPFDSITIEFSTAHYSYVIVILFDSFKELYERNLICSNTFTVRTRPTASIKDAIELAIKELRGCKRIFETKATPKIEPLAEPPKVETLAPLPVETLPSVKQVTIHDEIAKVEKKAAKSKKVKETESETSINDSNPE